MGDIFSDKNKECTEIRKDFFYACEEQHFVLTCKNHPFIDNASGMSCYCKVQGPCAVCIVSLQVRYTISKHTTKFCVKEVPENLKNNLVALDVFRRDELFACEPFFIFTNNDIITWIDNPLETHMLGKKVD